MKIVKAIWVTAMLGISGVGQSLYYPGGAKATDYQEGLRALDAQEWQTAAAAFTRVAESKGSAADGALYWKAYAESRAGQKLAAVNTLEELRRSMPESKWLGDAAALDAEIQTTKLSRGTFSSASLTSQPADTDIKLLAINSLMMSRPAVAVPALKNVLAGSNPAPVKDRALFVLAQSSAPEARQVVNELAKRASDTNLRIRAIRYVAMNGSDGAHELANMFPHEENKQIRSAILQSLSMGQNAKLLADLARSERNPERKAEIARYLFAMPSEEASRYAVEILKVQ